MQNSASTSVKPLFSAVQSGDGPAHSERSRVQRSAPGAIHCLRRRGTQGGFRYVPEFVKRAPRLHREAAVYLDHCSCYVGCGVAQQECGRRYYVLDFAEAAERNHRERLCSILFGQ